MKKNIFPLIIIISLTSINCGNLANEAIDALNPKAVEVQLEDAGNIYYASGTFGDPARRLKKTDGSYLTEGVDFEYGKALDNSDGEGYNIYDHNASGPFNEGRYLRIVEDGKNVSAADWLNLKVYAMDLSQMISPPGDRCYVDPVRGSFVLPRPSYWSKCESELNTCQTPEIRASTEPYWDNTFNINAVNDGKWNNRIEANKAPLTSNTLYPFGIDISSNKMTFSCWLENENTDGKDVRQYFWFGDLMILIRTFGSDNYHEIKISGVRKADSGINVSSAMHHLYIVIDSTGELEDGKTVRVFIDGVEKMSATDTITMNDVHKIVFLNDNVSSGYGKMWIDNIKIWNEVISEDPSFEYNSGIGREDALHYMYNLENGYKPILTSKNSGIGYFY